jgi:hypothetical protein
VSPIDRRDHQRRDHQRREEDTILKALGEQVKTFERFMERTENNLDGINESLKVLADVKAGMSYLRESSDRAFETMGKQEEKINDLYGRSSKVHGRIDVLDAQVKGHSFWMRFIAASVATGILVAAGSALLWVLTLMNGPKP